MQKSLLLLGLLFFTAALASGQTCYEPSQDSEGLDDPVDGSGAIGLSDLDEFLLFESREYGFAVPYPSAWTAEEADPNDLGIVAGFLPPGEDLIDPDNYVTVQIEDLPGGTNLPEYTEAVLANLRSSYDDFEVLAEGEMKISEEPAYVIAYGATVEGTAYQVLLAYTIKEDRAYIITYYALAERYSQFEDDAKRMINSFSLS